VAFGKTPNRVERRREERHARIVRVAAERFAEVGVAAVPLEDIAHQADLARATFYTHFRSKDALVAAVIRPALEQAVAALEPLHEKAPRAAVQGVLAAFVALWGRHRNALRVSHRMEGVLPEEIAALHDKLMTAVLGVLGRAARARLLRTGDAGLAARMLARLAVPVLELTTQASPDGALFVQSMAGLLLK
jgi:AcrR family transcriptional regulator